MVLKDGRRQGKHPLMMTSSNGNIFHVADNGDTDFWCFLWTAPQ